MTDAQNPPIRDAATILVFRDSADGPRVLMGQRGRTAAFMPGKFVFPGGAVDPEDYHTQMGGTLDPQCRKRLAKHLRIEAHGAGSDLRDVDAGAAFATAAIRELREETGLVLPEMTGLSFFFRAITPPRRPRRFDARFFLCDAQCLTGDLDDFSRAEDELSYLQWVSVHEAKSLDLPFVTRLVLREAIAARAKPMPPQNVPFYDHQSDIGQIRSL